MIKRGIFATDVHWPEHSTRAIKVFRKFLKDFKPDIFIMGGDWMNMDSMSHWAEKRDRLIELAPIKEEYDGFNGFLDWFLRGLPKKCEKVYMIGNHEDWANQYLMANPKFKGYIELDSNLKFKERGIKVIKYNEVYRLGKMNFIHGYYVNDHHTKKTCQNYRKSVFYGHTHCVQTYTHISPIDETDYHTAQSVGCLCSVNPLYMRHKPNRWVWGFLVFYYDTKDRSFSAYQVRIPNGKFTWNGKVYK